MKQCIFPREFYSRYPRELSGGQRQRVSLAQALLTGTKFILLDEALSALDVTVQAQMIRLLKELQEKQNLCYLFVSHDLDVVSQICDRVLFIKDGKVIETTGGEEQFNDFYDALINAEVVKPKEFEEKFFEGCMPFEEMARRGEQTLLFGPMKPVGLNTPEGKRPFAVVQLRQDNVQASLYNIVGFQTHLTWPEQKRIIHMIPGLENASFVRYGVMHRNSFICSPKHLLNTYQLKLANNIFMAGQITGVEGYVESAQSGIVAGINMARLLEGKEPLVFPKETVMGALANYITNASKDDFQPMKANFGILPDFPVRIKKKERKEAYATRAINTMKEFVVENGLG